MQSAVNQLSHTINPITGSHIVWDTTECMIYEENSLNGMLSIGFEPYAVTLCPDTRTEQRSKINLPGSPPNVMMMSNKIWLKRPRAVEQPSQALNEIPTITPGDSL